MISCSEAVSQMWELLDGAVEEPDRRAIEEHLQFCRRCCGELEFAQELRGFLASQAAAEIPSAVLERLSSTLDELEGGP